MSVLWLRETETEAVLSQASTKRRTFLACVSTSSRLEEAAVLQAAGVPRLGDVYSLGVQGGTGLRCMAVRARRHKDSAFIWEVEAEYAAPNGPGGGGDNRPDSITVPLERPTRIEWSYQEIEYTDGTDIAGAVQANTLGQPFLNPLPKHRVIDVITMTRNEPSYRDAIIWSLRGKRNQGAWNGFPSGSVLFRGARAVGPIFDMDQWYFEVTYEFAVDREKLWREFIINQGTRYKDAAGNVVATRDDSGVVTGEIVNLAADGTLLPPGAPPHLVEIETREAVSFAPLNLP